MAKKVCEDKANLLLNEKVEINLAGKKEQSYVDDVLHGNNFWVAGNQLIEIVNALGTGAIIEYIKDDKINLDFVEAKYIYPLTWDNGEITECAFASSIRRGDKTYIYINLHVLEDSKYVIKNYLIDNDTGAAINALPEEFDFEPVINTNSTTPFFQIIKPNIVNNISRENPMGVAVFANALDVLTGIDTIYDSYINEFDLGKKRIFVDASVVQVVVDKDTGKVVPTIDANDVVFYALNSIKGNGEEASIKEVNMELRIDEHTKGLNSNLNLLSAKCGFGQNFYSFENGNLKTATEVISENSDLYRSVKKDEIILEKALTDMARAILMLGNLFLGQSLDTETEITIDFDDSIIEDTAAERIGALQEYSTGLIGAIEYYKITRNLDDEGAKRFWQEQQESKIQAYAPAPWDGE